MKAIDDRVRAMLLAILVLGLVGTAVELLFLGHDETTVQLIPLVLIAAGLAVSLWNVIAGSLLSLQLMRWTMVAIVAAGLVGVALHYQGSVEFQKELDPTIQGFALFMKAMQAQAPPALAPGTLAQLGLLGLVCTYLAREKGKKA